MPKDPSLQLYHFPSYFLIAFPKKKKKKCLKEIDKKKYLVDAIYITRNQEWYYFDYDFSSLYQNEWEQTNQNDKISNILETLKKYDVVFPVFHGKYGEDGTYEGTSLGSFGVGSKITTSLSH